VSPVPGRIQSIERAAGILRLLSDSTRLHGVGELAGELELSKSTVHGILRTLQHVGFVEQDARSGRYRLGAALLHMGSSYLDGNELRTRALNWADALASRSDESVRIGTLHDGRVLVVHHVFRPDDTRQALDVGALLPAHATALGKVLLASRDYLYDEVAGAGLARFTGATRTGADPRRAGRRGGRDRRVRPGRAAVRGRGGEPPARVVRARGEPGDLARARRDPMVTRGIR
jgi:DNA-binding IclR family transcriptional regulator